MAFGSSLRALTAIAFLTNAIAQCQALSYAAPVLSRRAPGDASPTGDKQCSSLMCISATVNGSVTQYVMSSTGQTPGWMAMGFGSTMANTPMVIMWTNTDGSVTLSQRSAPSHTMPTVVGSPAQVAKADLALSTLSGKQQAYAFTVQSSSTAKTPVIWAFGTTNPGSSAVDARIVQHLGASSFTLDLSKSLTASTSGSGNNSTSGSGSGAGSYPGSGSSPSGSIVIPFKPYEKMIIAHAVLCTLGFLVLLPAGALLARYFRTVTHSWFKGHWIMQFLISGPVIITGIFLGIGAVGAHGSYHIDDTHKKLGTALFILYFIQCFLGTIIHFVKPKINTGRPIQNYSHAVLGLLIIALSFYQVRIGFKVEWVMQTGRDKLASGVDTVWYLWVVLVPFTYFAGLSLLPRQYKQERESRASAAKAQSKLITMIGKPAEAYEYSHYSYKR